MSNETLIAMRATAAQDIATAYPEAAWNALLSGDLDTALAAEPVHIDVGTGDPLSAREAERAFAARASASDDADKFWRENAHRNEDTLVADDGNGGELSVTPASGQESKADKAAREVLRKIMENE